MFLKYLAASINLLTVIAEALPKIFLIFRRAPKDTVLLESNPTELKDPGKS